MYHSAIKQSITAIGLACLAGSAMADLTAAATYTGHVGLSVDGIGSNSTPVGEVQAQIPVGATILKAYLYSAGTPSPFYADSPSTLAQYNSSGITLGGLAVNNFDTLVGAVSTRADIGRWYTGRADVTSLVQTLTAGAGGASFSWVVNEGLLNERIDGEVLAIAYSHPSLPEGSLAFLDGGQRTGGETTHVAFNEPLTNPADAGFAASFGIASSFSCCGQQSTLSVNGVLLSPFAGGLNDGAAAVDGSLITVGGLGDNPANNVASYEDDDELYDLRPFLVEGETAMTLSTANETNDDNIFFAHLYVTGKIGDITPPPVPEPGTYALMLAGLAATGWAARRRRQG